MTYVDTHTLHVLDYIEGERHDARQALCEHRPLTMMRSDGRRVPIHSIHDMLDVVRERAAHVVTATVSMSDPEGPDVIAWYGTTNLAAALYTLDATMNNDPEISANLLNTHVERSIAVAPYVWLAYLRSMVEHTCDLIDLSMTDPSLREVAREQLVATLVIIHARGMA